MQSKMFTSIFEWLTNNSAETWSLRKEDIRRIEALEMWIWRRMERISWTEKITNEEVLRRVGENRSMVETIV
jgi:hypothetical protein